MPQQKNTPANRLAAAAAAGIAAPQHLENLENRTLFSVINVANYGAVANDGRDDSGAITAAYRASRAGDTIQFGAGQYDMNSRVEMRWGLTLAGAGRDKTTIRSGNGMYAFYFRHDGLRANDIKFDGGAFLFDRGDGVPNNDIKINNCDFVNFNRGTDPAGGAMEANAWRVNNLSVTNCSFREARNAIAMYFYTGDNWNITDNEFINTNGGIKSNNAGNLARNITISRNYWSGTSRMGAELQGQVDGFWFQDNVYENPVVSSNFNDNNSLFAWSVIYHGNSTKNQHLNRNTVKAPQRPDGTGVRLTFETGNNADVSDNYVNGCGTFVSMYMGDSGTTSNASAIGRSSVVNNKLVDVKWGQGDAYGPFGGNVTWSNNNANTNLSWDINRARPGPNRGGSSSGGGGGTGGSGTGGSGTGGSGTGGTGATPLVPNPAGTGLAATYFSDTSLTRTALSRTEANVNFDWGNGSPGAGVPNDRFSARWVGKVFAPVTGQYTFTTRSDDGVRLWVNGQQLVNNWSAHAPADNSGTITLTAGQKYDIKMEYYEDGNGAVSQLSWSAPGINKQIIPQADLFPGTVVADPTDPVDPPPGGYLSDMTWASSKNGWGPVEKDKSLGESAAGDGRTLTIAGKTYSKGLGVAHASEVVYNLAGRYATFFSDVGIDAEVGKSGSMNFQLWADGRMIYDSGKMTGGQAAKAVQVSVAGVQQLKLVGTDGGDGTNNDHGDWGNARVV